jgi:hypothetical protein
VNAPATICVRTAGDASRQWHTLLPFPHENPGFAEKGDYLIEKPGPGWVFRIDDAPLGEASAPGFWSWRPGFFAGEVTAELIRPDGTTEALFLLDVSPDPRKLGRDVFARMLDEIFADDPVLVLGSEPATRPVGELGATQDPWIEFARLRRHAPDFLRALRQIAVRPRRALLMRREAVPVHRARRVDRHTGAALFRSSTLMDFFSRTEHSPDVLVEGVLDVPVTEETFDAAANRAILSLAQAVLRRMRVLDATLERTVRSEAASETQTALAPRWPARREFLRSAAAELNRVLRHQPFDAVRRPEVTAAGLTAIAADPVYSRAWGRGWRALRHGIEGAAGTDRLWISPSWQVYERWCFVRLAKMLSTSLSHWEWRRPAVDRWVATSGGRSLELTLQPTFRSFPHDSGSAFSISRQREPDIVLKAEGAEGGRFIVLDAKYRAAREHVLDAMASAHIYQDSLRLGGRRPEASLLLVPAGGGATWLEDPAFHVEHRVGVHPFAPGDQMALPAVVGGMLASM